MDLRFRTLGPGDEALLVNAAPDVFDDPVNPSATREFLADPRHKIAVALADDVVVGFATGVIYVHPDKPRPELWINEVGVAASHRGRGAGHGVVATLLAEAAGAGCSVAWVLTEQDNAAALGLYRATGGRDAGPGIVMYEFPLDQP